MHRERAERKIFITRAGKVVHMQQRKVLLASGSACVVLIALSLLLASNFVISTNLLLVALLVLVVPVYINRFLEYKKIRDYEKQFPNFLRDLAESQRAGLSILQAMSAAAKSEYGTLSNEIVKMNNQLSWNVPMEKVLTNFMRQTRGSKTITRSVMVIIQANRSGGNVEETMESLASNIELLKDVQEEKASLMSQQVIMMYAIFFIFVGISIALIKFLIPLLQTQSAAGSGTFGLANFQSNPCQACVGSTDIGSCFGCTIFSSVSATFSFGEFNDPASYYRALFFTMILIQGFFSGLIAGQIGSDSVIAGIRHSMIMLVAGFFTFIIVVRLGII